MPAWDSLKLPDKLDLAEINCKDLSPLSCYDTPLDSQYTWGTTLNTYSFELKPNSYSSSTQVGNCEPTATIANISDQSTSPNEVYKSCCYSSGGVNQQPTQSVYGKCTTYYNTYSDASNYYAPSVFVRQKPTIYACE